MELPRLGTLGRSRSRSRYVYVLFSRCCPVIAMGSFGGIRIQERATRGEAEE